MGDFEILSLISNQFSKDDLILIKNIINISYKESLGSTNKLVENEFRFNLLPDSRREIINSKLYQYFEGHPNFNVQKVWNKANNYCYLLIKSDKINIQINHKSDINSKLPKCHFREIHEQYNLFEGNFEEEERISLYLIHCSKDVFSDQPDFVGFEVPNLTTTKFSLLNLIEISEMNCDIQPEVVSPVEIYIKKENINKGAI